MQEYGKDDIVFDPLALGTNHMLGVDNFVPLTTNNFEIRVYNMDGSTPEGNADLLTLSTDEIGEISEEQDIITVHYGNGLIKFPGVALFSCHDHQFVQTTANRIMELLPGGGLIDKITTSQTGGH